MTLTFLGVRVLLLSVSIVAIKASGCDNINIISRSGWGGRSPTNVRYLRPPLPYVFILHTASSTCYSRSSCSSVVRGIQRHHMNTNGWADIGYSFLIGGDGNIYEARGWDIVGAHTRSYNYDGYGIGFMGDYTSRLPSASMLYAAKQLIDCGIYLDKISPDYLLYGHRDLVNTAGPGDALYRVINGWPHYFKNHEHIFG